MMVWIEFNNQDRALFYDWLKYCVQKIAPKVYDQQDIAYTRLTDICEGRVQQGYPIYVISVLTILRLMHVVINDCKYGIKDDNTHI